MQKVEFETETLIIGAGLVGSSLAMHLAELGHSEVCVVDPDLEGVFSSSELNAGGVRATLVQPINIELSRDSIRYFQTVQDEVGYRSCGYMWMHSEKKFQLALKAREVQTRLGWEVNVLDVPQLQKALPFVDKLEGIAGAIFAPQDGLVNSNLLKLHYRRLAKQRGTQFKDRSFVCAIEKESKSSPYIFVDVLELPKFASQDLILSFLKGNTSHSECRKIRYKTKQIVNCAGAWAPKIAKLLGYTCPSEPIKRQVVVFSSKEVDLNDYGMIIDPSGVYFHPEAMNCLSGFSSMKQDPGYDFDFEGEEFFMNWIWPMLYERSTAFEKLKYITGWAGLYEVSPDESAIIGKVTQLQDETLKGKVFEAHSFSGHGAMQSYSAGKELAHLILNNRFDQLDVSQLCGDRFAAQKHVLESFVI